MTPNCWRSLFILLCALSAPVVHAAEAPRQLVWDDLTVKWTAENPFLSLTEEQLLTLSVVAGVRDRRARADNISPADSSNERAGTAKLEKEGINVTGLLARRNEIGEKQRALA